MGTIWQSLLANLALVSIFLVGWDIISDLARRTSRKVQDLLLGAVMAGGAIISMLLAMPIASGFIVDLRSAFIASAAFFGGWRAAAIATLCAIAFRLYLGGAGAWPGVTGILISAAVGLGYHYAIGGRRRKSVDILGLGAAVAAGSAIGFMLFPSHAGLEIFKQAGLPLLSFVFVSQIIIGVLLDRQWRRRELAEANLIFSAMVRELPDCLNVKDSQGRFIAANPATARFMRAGSVDALIGKTDFDFFPKDLAEKFRQDEVSTLERGETVRIDQPAVFPDERKGWIATLKAPFRDEAGRIVGIITYNRDVTEQRRAAQLKNEFISTVSHELRTPLTSIRGSLGLIAAGVTGALPPKTANLVKIAHTNSERLVHLINDILDMEKIESGKMVFQVTRTALRPVLEQAIAGSTNYMSEKQIRIALMDDAPRAEAVLDPDRLHQVLANLLSNAIKFSPDGETVILRLQRQPGRKLRISVIDRGSGIPDTFQDQIFEKFAQADASNTRSKGGTGLGLSIAKTIVEKLGGSLSFETGEGTGTAFHVDLLEAERPPRPEPAVIVRKRDNRLRVLICEDEADISAVLAMLLDAENFTSDVAPDIASAKTLLRTRDYVAMTLDIKLAGESGIELFRHIRASATNADIPVIVISAVADETRRSLNGSAIGIVDWLEKPVDPDRLHAALEKIVTRKLDRRPNILHVEDDEGVLTVMSEGLGPDVCISSARSLVQAQEAIALQRFDLVILDIGLPDGSGLDLLKDLPPETPVIVFSAVELDQNLGDRVRAIMTKTKTSELDVARLVKNLLPTFDIHIHATTPGE
ncbi:ATP-binding protein [Labrys sp. 22185]|uniref:ATP-binding protein n=1 Tax=Labrys sp. 22185 TaxID=3453888 RepID=UPI003F85172E